MIVSAAQAAKLHPPRALGRLSALARALAHNPILLRDIRSIFRGPRAFLLQLLYVLGLGVAMGIAALICYQSTSGGPYIPLPLLGYGRYMFIGIFEVQVALLALVVLAYSAPAVSLEREKQTYDSLATTCLTSAEIVTGKVTSITLLCALLLLISAPLAALCLLFGGISPADVALSYGLLLLKVPLWASFGILASVGVGRSTAAYATTLGFLFAETQISFGLSHLTGSPSGPGGIFHPILAPFAAEIGCEFLGRTVPPWLLPLPYHLILTAILITGAAESMLHFRPKRTALLRGLLIALTFLMAFSLPSSSTVALATRQPGPLLQFLLPALALVWVWACAFVPAFTSYPPQLNPGPQAPSLSALLLSPKYWFRRDARVGASFCLLLWAVGILGLFSALLVAATAPFAAHGGAPGYQRLAISSLWITPALLPVLAIYALSLLAYAAWGVVLALVYRLRREGALVTLLIMLAFNAVGFIYLLGYTVMRKPPTNPLLVLASPAAASSVVFASGLRSTMFRHFSLEEGLIFGLGYPVLLLSAAYWFYCRKQRSPAPSRPTPNGPSVATPQGESV